MNAVLQSGISIPSSSTLMEAIASIVLFLNASIIKSLSALDSLEVIFDTVQFKLFNNLVTEFICLISSPVSSSTLPVPQ